MIINGIIGWKKEEKGTRYPSECHHMDWLGIRIDTEKNKHPVGDVCEITAWGAKVRTLVIATDEELMIARDTKEVLEK